MYELQVEFKRWKRRLALRQAVLNRGEEPDLDAIEETLKREFAEYLKEIARHLQELEESSRLFDAKSLSDEEDAAVRSAYLDAVKRLHRDLNPGLPQAARNLWDQIQQAYADHDWAAVLLLAGLAESVASGEADFAASADGIAALLLRRTARDAADRRAVAVRTEGGVLLGYLPRRHSAVMARLMDAGKCLSVKVVGKKLEGHWMDITVLIELCDWTVRQKENRKQKSCRCRAQLQKSRRGMNPPLLFSVGQPLKDLDLFRLSLGTLLHDDREDAVLDLCGERRRIGHFGDLGAHRVVHPFELFGDLLEAGRILVLRMRLEREGLALHVKIGILLADARHDDLQFVFLGTLRKCSRRDYEFFLVHFRLLSFC